MNAPVLLSNEQWTLFERDGFLRLAGPLDAGRVEQLRVACLHLRELDQAAPAQPCPKQPLCRRFKSCTASGSLELQGPAVRAADIRACSAGLLKSARCMDPPKGKQLTASPSHDPYGQ